MLSIAVGEYKAGDKLLPVRELAAEAEVNPNTMQKALSELERDGLLYSQRTSGRYITDDAEKITALRKNLAAGNSAFPKKPRLKRFVISQKQTEREKINVH